VGRLRKSGRLHRRVPPDRGHAALLDLPRPRPRGRSSLAASTDVARHAGCDGLTLRPTAAKAEALLKGFRDGHALPIEFDIDAPLHTAAPLAFQPGAVLSIVRHVERAAATANMYSITDLATPGPLQRTLLRPACCRDQVARYTPRPDNKPDHRLDVLHVDRALETLAVDRHRRAIYIRKLADDVNIDLPIEATRCPGSLASKTISASSPPISLSRSWIWDSYGRQSRSPLTLSCYWRAPAEIGAS
jgi:hypothetical protein